MTRQTIDSASRWRHLNKARWLTLVLVFALLIILPFFHVYQTYVAAHAYDLLAPGERKLYDIIETLTAPFVDDPSRDLDVIKGNTWSGRLFGVKMSDPLAVAGQMAAGRNVYNPFLLTALFPVVATLIFGRFFCGWLCPANLLYELNTNLRILLGRFGVRTGRRCLDPKLKYIVLGVGLLICGISGSVLVAAVYPPAILGRELYYAIAQRGMGVGALFFVATVLFDLLVARRGFCRYLCPGGALYSLLGRFRVLRIQRNVVTCNDCTKCNSVCEFGLNPLRDDFGQECNNCTACIAVCPVDALGFRWRITDTPNQGPGHESPRYRRDHKDKRQVFGNANSKA
ncbi:MAG: 4Fe-4S binding protein [Pseudomonadota bacterium]